MAISITKPAKTITGYNDEVFDNKEEALECAEWLLNENGDEAGDLYVFEKEEGQWVVAW